MIDLQINAAYAEALQREDRFCVLYGGAGSGKSWFAASKLILRGLQDGRHRFLCVRKVARTLRESVFRLLRDQLRGMGLLADCYLNKTEKRIRLPNGAELICTGLDDPEKLKSVQSVSGVWVEEATELKEDDLHQVNLRLRGDTPGYKQILLTFNPVHKRHWLREQVVEADRDDVYALRTTYTDNAFLDHEEYGQALRQGDEVDRQVYLKGEWGEDREGLIYPDWKVDRWPEDPEEVVYGMDFGFNAPTALVRVARIEDTIWIDELIYARERTTPEIARRINDQDLVDGYCPAYADSAEPDRIEQLKKAGIRFDGAEKAVLAGIDAVKEYDLRVTPGSVNVKNELQEYRWQTDKGDDLIDRPQKKHDHSLDALRYAVYSEWGKSSPEAFVAFGEPDEAWWFEDDPEDFKGSESYWPYDEDQPDPEMRPMT